MDKLKSAVGMGGKQEEGQEPVSGTKGEGTTAEPYDSGNNQNATQVADQTQDENAIAPGQTDGLAQQKGAVPAVTTTTTNDNDADTPRSPSSAGKQPDRGGSVASSGGLSPDRARSAGSGTGANQLLGSRGEHRGSMIPADAPKYKRVENPDRIPIAGGKRIGEEQYQTRRASVAPSSSPPRDMQKLDREGSPDPVTATNTEANVAPKPTAPVPEGKNTAPQKMKEFSMGDASKFLLRSISIGIPLPILLLFSFVNLLRLLSFVNLLRLLGIVIVIFLAGAVVEVDGAEGEGEAAVAVLLVVAGGGRGEAVGFLRDGRLVSLHSLWFLLLSVTIRGRKGRRREWKLKRGERKGENGGEWRALKDYYRIREREYC